MLCGPLRLATVVALLTTAGPAWAAGPPDAESRFWEARLLESADGDMDRAIAIYRELARTLDAEDEALLRVRALLALGRAHLALGQLEEARAALDTCRRVSSSGLAQVDTSACAAASRRVALEEGAIQTLPARWGFAEGTHGFVLNAARGSMTIEGTGRDARLVWTQDIAGPQTAELVAAFQDPVPAPSGLRMTVRSEDRNALLEILVEDVQGRSYTLSGKLFRADRQDRVWEVSMEDLTPLDPNWPPLDPAAIAIVRLRDSTGSQLPTVQARHRIVLDDFEVF